MFVTTVSCLFIIGVEVLTTGRTGVMHGVVGVHTVVDESVPRSQLPHILLALAFVLRVVTGMMNKHTH